MNKKEKKILLAEDDTFISRAYRIGLEQSGFNVYSARSGEEAIGKIRSEKPGLILLDLIVPIKDGFDVLGRIGADEELSVIPIIVFSSMGQDADIEKANELGAVDYLMRIDVSIKKLLDKVNEHFPG